MSKAFDIYVGKVMSKPRIMVIYNRNAIKNVDKAVERCQKDFEKLDKVLKEEIHERFISFLVENDYIKVKADLKDYMILAPKSLIDWGDVDKTMLVYTPDVLASILKDETRYPTKALVMTDVEKWY